MLKLKLLKSTNLLLLSVMCIVASSCGATRSVSSEETDQIDNIPEYGDSLDDLGENTGVNFETEIPSLPGYNSIEWEDLVPPGFSSEDIYARYADRLEVIEDGSPEANDLYLEMQAEFDGDAINAELDGQKIQLAGFVSPLSYEEDIVTEFLFVPYFGACIHVPAPPPNQTILVTVKQEDGFTFRETDGPVWIAGTLNASSTTTELATANYTINADQRGLYQAY